MNIEYLSDDRGTIEQVARWLFEQWGHLNRAGSLERAIERISERAGRDTIPFAVIARENNSVVGTASLVAQDMDRTEFTPWLASVYVVSSYRRLGIGTLLCQRVVQEASRLGFRRIYLFTYDKADFYKNLGWNQVEMSTYRNQPVTIMDYIVDETRTS